VFGALITCRMMATMRDKANENLSPADMLKNLGLKNIEIVPVTSELTHGIQATRDSFSTCWFDEVKCKEGITHLDSYRKKWNNTTGNFTDSPVKDIHTEGADSFRQFGQMMASGLLNQVAPKAINFNSEW